MIKSEKMSRRKKLRIRNKLVVKKSCILVARNPLVGLRFIHAEKKDTTQFMLFFRRNYKRDHGSREIMNKRI